MKFVIKHPTRASWLRKPEFPGDRVQWTGPGTTEERKPWVFSTYSGASKARDMHALEASVEPWYEAGDHAETPHLSPSNVQRWRDCPASYSTAVEPTPTYDSGMQSYMLLAPIFWFDSDYFEF